MLEAINLSKRYDSLEALSNLNLQVGPGEIFCLLGANGAGKSTTINLFMNFIKPSNGSVLINGLDVNKETKSVKRDIAYIPENLTLYGNLSASENLQFFTGLNGNKLTQADCKQLLINSGLQATDCDRRVSKFSKGMRQKVGIAIAKAKQADNLLLDEPTSGLDPQASNDFAQLLEDLKKDQVAILMATHDLFRAKETGTHIGIMKSGRLVRILESDETTLMELEELYMETMNGQSYVENSH